MMFLDDASRWTAVQARDPLADGSFVYAVKTTKVFCRPICKARLARRANVRFYSSPEAARDAGYRACKRCKPLSLGGMPEDAAVQKIRAFVRDRAAAHDDYLYMHAQAGDEKPVGGGTSMSLGDMARRTGLSKWHFHRAFKKCVGVTPLEYLAREGQAALHRATMMRLDADLEVHRQWLKQQVESELWASPPEGASEEASPEEDPSRAGITTSEFALEGLLSWPEDQ